MLVYGADGELERVNPAFCSMIGATEREILSGSTDLGDPMDLNVDARIYTRMLESNAKVTSELRRYRRSDGQTVHTRVKAVASRTQSDELAAYLLQIVDITESEALRRELDRVITTDALTGLDDRAMVMRRLERELDSMQNIGKLALLLVDVVRLRDVNEAWGHDVGDGLLVALSERLRECIPSSGWMGRVAGDEFAVVIPNTDSAAAASVAQSLIESVVEPVAVGPRRLPVSLNVGIARYPLDAVDGRSLLRCADVAMRSARRRSTRSMLYDEKLESNAAARLSTEVRLRKALAEGSLELTFEPVLDACTGQLAFCEALVRWRRGGKLVGPTTFISIAEEMGLVHDIDRLVLRRAMRQMGRMKDETRPDVSVNLSPLSLLDPRLLERILVELSYHALPPSSLIVEMTETSLAGHHERIGPILKSLRRQGIRVAIDDFGAGYTSLGLLRTLEVDFVKVDGSFIEGIGRCAMDETIIESVIAIARQRNITVVAEGVERPEQYRWLTDHGCDLVQGHLFRQKTAAA